MNAEDRGFIFELSQALEQADRLGADADSPEGARNIQISDTLARQWARRLFDIWESAEMEQVHFYPHLVRLIGLVQGNPEFFGARCGESCLEKAADKLEGLIGGERSV